MEGRSSVCKEPSESPQRETIDLYFVNLKNSLAGLAVSLSLLFSANFPEHSYIVSVVKIVDKISEQDVSYSVKHIIRNLFTYSSISKVSNSFFIFYSL